MFALFLYTLVNIQAFEINNDQTFLQVNPDDVKKLVGKSPPEGATDFEMIKMDEIKVHEIRGNGKSLTIDSSGYLSFEEPKANGNATQFHFVRPDNNEDYAQIRPLSNMCVTNTYKGSEGFILTPCTDDHNQRFMLNGGTVPVAGNYRRQIANKEPAKMEETRFLDRNKSMNGFNSTAFKSTTTKQTKLY